MRTVLVASLLLCALPSLSSAQESRAQLIEQARREFDTQARVALLVRAADPGLAPVDSVWADGVHELAQALLSEGEQTTAGVWLRWAAWLGEQWQIDTVAMLPEVVLAQQNASSSAARRVPAADPLVGADWRWDGAVGAGQAGTLELAGDQPQSVSVTVGGQTVSAGAPVQLAPGSYTMTATADGFEQASVVREVLPGVATVLRFDLTPALTAATRSRLERSTVRIRALRDGQVLCGTGYVASSDGYVITNFEAIRDADRVDVDFGGETQTGVPVVATNVGRGLAALRLDAENTPALEVGQRAGAGEGVGWTYHYPNCTAPAQAISTYVPAGQRGGAPVALSRPLSAATPGSALVDESGALLGAVAAGNRASPAAWGDALVEEGRAFIVEAPGGPPWILIGGGAAAVGAAVALLGGGGGGGVEPPPLGSITITFDQLLSILRLGGGQ